MLAREPTEAPARAHKHWHEVKAALQATSAHAFMDAVAHKTGPAAKFTAVDDAPQPWEGALIPTARDLPIGWERVMVGTGQGTGRILFVDHCKHHTSTVPPTSNKPRLPLGWEQRLSGSSRIFFVDLSRKRTQWQLPLALAAEESAAASGHPANIGDLANANDIKDHFNAMLARIRKTEYTNKKLVTDSTNKVQRSQQIQSAAVNRAVAATTIQAWYRGCRDRKILAAHHRVRTPSHAFKKPEHKLPPIRTLPPRPHTHVKGGRSVMLRKHSSMKVSDAKQQAASDANKILANIVAGSNEYTDPEFKPPSDVPHTKFSRPRDLKYDRSAHTFFKTIPAPFKLYDRPLITDINQGTLGDCWWCSSCGIIGSYKDGALLKALFPGQSGDTNTKGAYVVRLCVGGLWKLITIDDRLPTLTTNGDDRTRRLAFLSTARLQLWGSLLEKAYAKVCGGYEKLKSGLAAEALTTLTGWPTEFILLDPDNEHLTASSREEYRNDVWDKLRTASAKNCLMTIATTNSNVLGLIPNHCYALRGVIEVTLGGKVNRLFHIYNPHGEGEWQGAWSDGSKEWTDSTRKQVDYADNGDDGSFYMEFNDVIKHFDDAAICDMDDKFTEIRVPVLLVPKFASLHPVIELNLSQDSQVSISLAQPFARALPKGENLTDLAFVVLRRKDNGDMIHTSLAEYVTSADMQVTSIVTTRVALKAGSYLVVPFTFMNKRPFSNPKRVTCVIHSESPQIRVTQHTIGVAQLRLALRAYISGGGKSTVDDTLGYVAHARTSGHGLLLWFENQSDHWNMKFDLTLNYDKAALWCTRGGGVMKDVLPPGHGKLAGVLIMSGLAEGYSGCPYSWGYAVSQMSGSAYGAVENTHDFDDLHATVLNQWIYNTELPQIGHVELNGKPHTIIRELILPAKYDDGTNRPVLEVHVRRECKCSIIVSAPELDVRLRGEEDDLLSSNGTDYAFVVIDVHGNYICSGATRASGMSSAEVQLQSGTFRIVPINISGVTDHKMHTVKISILSDQTVVKVSEIEISLSLYRTALRSYIVDGSTETEMYDGQPITRYIRRDGEGLFIWVDNASLTQICNHVFSLTAPAELVGSRELSDGVSEYVQPQSGRLVAAVVPKHVRKGYDDQFAIGWLVNANYPKDDSDGGFPLHRSVPL